MDFGSSAHDLYVPEQHQPHHLGQHWLNCCRGRYCRDNNQRDACCDGHRAGAASLTFTVGSVPTNGTLFKNAVALAASGTFTQEEINNNLITYSHNGGETISDGFSFTVSDGAGGSIASTNFAITVTPVNDSPVLTNNLGLTGVVLNATATIYSGNLASQ